MIIDEKILVQMYLATDSTEAKNNINHLYNKFRSRAFKRSDEVSLNRGHNHVKMSINIRHPMMDFNENVFVKHNSFNLVLMPEGEKSVEVGFSVIIFIAYSLEPYILYVYKSGDAFIEKRLAGF